MIRYDRANPYLSHIKERHPLTKPGSTKSTYHISLSLRGSLISYRPGDSIAVLPSNDPDLVAELLHFVRLSGDAVIHDPRSQASLTLAEYLTRKANLQKASPALLRALQERYPLPQTEELLIPENKASLSQFLEIQTPADLFALHSSAVLSPQEIAKFLLPMLPRFYSIASSSLLHPEEVHLTVAELRYLSGGKWRHGVGTHFLTRRALPDATPIPLYVQPSHGFLLPADLTMPIILIGPGTGIAPFRAFLQERMATHAKGRNWLFFGERHRATDFYYEDFWLGLQKQGQLRLDLAFSRDSADKIYVQHKMWEQRKDLWSWIEEGASIYVCGDAQKMAKDVEETLQRIAAAEGGLSNEEARHKVKALRASKRYLADVY